MDDAHVEQDFGCVGNLLKLAQCLVELIVVVPRKGGDPGFYFLQQLLANTVQDVGAEFSAPAGGSVCAKYLF